MKWPPLSEKEKRLALLLWDAGMFKDKRKSPNGKGFFLKLHEKNPHDRLSPFYLDFRTQDNPKPGPLTPEILKEIGKQMCDVARELKLSYDYAAGVPRAGDPLALSFSYALLFKDAVHVLQLGKEDSETKRQITGIVDGEYQPGGIVLLIDDLITKADSKREAIQVLQAYGLSVKDILVVVDREQGGTEELKKDGHNVYALFMITHLIEFYLNKGLLDQKMCREICDYLSSEKN